MASSKLTRSKCIVLCTVALRSADFIAAATAAESGRTPLVQRAIAYIDGFNLYFGLKSKGWRRYYWINPRALVLNLLRPEQQLTVVKYCTSR